MTAGEQTMTNETRHTGARQRPFWLIGAVVVGFVVLVLAAAFLLDRQFRAPIGTRSAPTGSSGSAVAGVQTQSQAAPAVQVPWQRIGRTPQEREVEEAYARYWAVFTDAYSLIDDSRLPEVMAGDELERARIQIRKLREQGRAGTLIMELHPRFSEVAPDRVVIYDEQVNRSVYVEPVTKQSIPTSQAPEVEKVSYELRKVDGVWKVVDGWVHDE